MNGRNKHRRESSDGVRSFRLEHGGQELFVVSAPTAPSSAASLTRAEFEVARALVGGATNAEIARMRGTAVSTVAKQVASILRRLGAKSRAHAAIKLAVIDFGRDLPPK
jgi:DNA-binding NarL/FixJ family response regulator